MTRPLVMRRRFMGTLSFLRREQACQFASFFGCGAVVGRQFRFENGQFCFGFLPALLLERPLGPLRLALRGNELTFLVVKARVDVLLSLKFPDPCSQPEVQSFAPKPTALVGLDHFVVPVCQTPTADGLIRRVINEILGSAKDSLVNVLLLILVYFRRARRTQ